MKNAQPQHLILDADDTLWENNVYFEEAFDRFYDFLDHSTMSPAQVRAALDEIEIVNNQIHGYGALNFGRNLTQCYKHLCERGISGPDIEKVVGFAEEILSAPMELIPGVEETLTRLGEVHELTLFTKGHPEEQMAKVERSGLRKFFRNTVVAKEKNVASYRLLVAENQYDAEKAWMIGNSPKSDINPALEAGLGAVLVPHERTWGLERAHIPQGHPRLIQVERFSDLTTIFL